MLAHKSECVGRETKVRKSMTSHYKCDDYYFLEYRCQNKTIVVVEELSNQRHTGKDGDHG